MIANKIISIDHKVIQSNVRVKCSKISEVEFLGVVAVTPTEWTLPRVVSQSHALFWYLPC